jgi:hypothetical protein
LAHIPVPDPDLCARQRPVLDPVSAERPWGRPRLPGRRLRGGVHLAHVLCGGSHDRSQAGAVTAAAHAGGLACASGSRVRVRPRCPLLALALESLECSRSFRRLGDGPERTAPGSREGAQSQGSEYDVADQGAVDEQGFSVASVDANLRSANVLPQRRSPIAYDGASPRRHPDRAESRQSAEARRVPHDGLFSSPARPRLHAK